MSDLDGLLGAFHQFLGRLTDIALIVERGCNVVSKEREAEIGASDPPGLRYSEDGEPLDDEAAYYEMKYDRCVAAWEDIGMSQDITERLVRVCLNHAVEVFVKGVALESHQRIGRPELPPVGESAWNPIKWFQEAEST